MATSGSVTTNAAQEGRYYTVSWSASQSVTNNQSTISWTLSCAGGVSWYAERTLKVVVAGSTVVDKTARVERYAGNIASGTVIVTHDANGNASFSISIQAAVYTSSVNCTGSKSFTLDTIPRKSEITSIANGTLGTAQTIGITRKSSSFRHTITYWSGSASGTICTKSTSTSISFTPPLSLASQNTTGTSLTVGIRIETFNGNTSIGYSNYYITCAIPASVKPSCSLSLSDATGKASTYGGYIKGVSKVAVKVNTATSYGSAIASYSTSVNGSTYDGASFTTGVLKSSGTLAVSATVKDKRGRSGSASSNITVLDYSAPAITLFKVQRCNSDGSLNDRGEYSKVTFSYRATSLSSKNHCSCAIKYKKASESTYTTVEQTALADNFSVSEATYIFAADSGSSYNVGISVSDDFKTSSSSTSLSTASVIMHWLSSGLGMAIGKVAEIENALEVAWDTKFRKGLSVDGVTELNGDAYVKANLYDSSNMSFRNGLVAYTGSGDNAIDPNTTLEELILTDKNTPINNFMYIRTMFYATKTATSARAQYAFPYSVSGSLYHRYYTSSWSAWKRCVNAGENRWTLLTVHRGTDIKDVTSTAIDTGTEFMITVSPGDGVNTRVLASTNVIGSVFRATRSHSNYGAHQAYYNSSYYGGASYIGSNKLRIQGGTMNSYMRIYVSNY